VRIANNSKVVITLNDRHERLLLGTDSVLEKSHSDHIMPTIDFSEYLDGLYRYASMLSRNRAEAEDLVQETCLRALRAMDRLRPDSNIKRWLFTILRNAWFNKLRRWRRAPEIIEFESDRTGPVSVADTAKDPHATYVNNIEQEQVRNAIRRLSIDLREIIVLREYEELSYLEIATVLDCPLGTVMSRLARARSKLRDLLSPIIGGVAIGKENHSRRGDDLNIRLGQGG
jgi:RNA polymerase sigma-70 factor (ECF subfamily)